MSNRFRLRAVRRPDWQDIAIYLYDDTLSGISELQDCKVILTKIPEGNSAKPLIEIQDNNIQQLMDDLWVAGIRPTEKINPTGNQVIAMGKHIDDLRYLLFKKVPKDLR